MLQKYELGLIVELSTTEVEYIVLIENDKQLLSIKKFLYEFDLDVKEL